MMTDMFLSFALSLPVSDVALIVYFLVVAFPAVTVTTILLITPGGSEIAVLFATSAPFNVTEDTFARLDSGIAVRLTGLMEDGTLIVYVVMSGLNVPSLKAPPAIDNKISFDDVFESVCRTSVIAYVSFVVPSGAVTVIFMVFEPGLRAIEPQSATASSFDSTATLAPSFSAKAFAHREMAAVDTMAEKLRDEPS
ncbi:MAG TPA: hypothetical protein PLC40_10520, partial [Candidatus Hydrogenedentes bacterium]|nr:hypothetical protein [Candidatus Hydrogenedentota bacterium]